ncbi:MAG: HWE histidine kinase domain-containing protein [Candidatus Kaistia colombiensis]|nr:MAG: HWE histidine kinase domain-containing protein [Kaistia sp.]
MSKVVDLRAKTTNVALASFALAASLAFELIPLSDEEIAAELGLLALISAVVLLRGHLLTLTATFFNACFIIWMAFSHRADFHGKGTIPFFLILGAGLAFLLHEYWRRENQTAAALSPVAPPLAAAEANAASLHQQAFEHAAVGLAILGADGELLETNRRLCELLGYGKQARPPRFLDSLIQAADQPSCRDRLGSLLAGVGAPFEFEARLVGRDRAMFWARITLSLCPADAALPRSILVAINDITDQRHALDAEKELLLLALAAGRLGIWQIDLQRNTVLGSDNFWSILGLPSASGRSLDELSAVIHPADWPRFVASGALASAEDLDIEIRVLRPDGHIRWVALRAREEHRADRTLRTGIAADLTDRRERTLLRANAKKRESIVLELRHRLSNLFPVIMALVNLMDAPENDIASYKQALIGRIRALEATHHLLARHATGAALLRDIVAQELKPYRQAHNLTIAGPPILMSDGAAESFVMIVHELATNSVKYGALGTGDGHVSVEWSVPADANGDILFLWVEQGRQTTTTASRRGFGSSVLGAGGAPLVGHSPSMEILDDGLRYSLRLSRNDIRPSSTFS